MSSQKIRRRQTIQPSLNTKLLPTSLINQFTISEHGSKKSFDTNVSKDHSQSQQSETIPVQPTKKPNAQPRKSIKGVFPLLKKNSNAQSTSDKQQGILYGGDNTNSSVYDKYKQNFAKLLLQGLTGDKKSKDGDQGDEKQGGAGSNKLTPMPQLQKKGNTNNVNKDVFAKAERSAVVMRRMEYNAKLANRKTVKKSTNKGPPLSKVKFLQKMIRGFLIRKKIINKAKYIRKMCKAFRLKNLSKHFIFFMKQTRPKKKKQNQIKKAIPPPIIEETPSPPLSKETLHPLTENIQPFVNQIEKIFDNTSCQTSFIIQPEETPKEKYLDLISGGTSKSQNTCINGIKTFPRLKVELGNNEKLLKKMYKRLNKLRMDDIQIDTKQKLQFNLNTPNDNAVQSVVQKLLDLRLDTTSSPKNNAFKVNEIQIASQHNEVSSFAVLSNNNNNTNKALSYVRSLIKFKVKNDKSMFITKRIYSNYQRKMKERRNMKIKLFIIVLSHLSCKQIRKYVLYVFNKKCCAHLTRNKSAFSVFSIEDEVDDFDEENIQNMKRNATIDMNPLRHRKTCCSTLSKECSNDNYVDDDINVDYINGE
jgi:hypothetical protein